MNSKSNSGALMSKQADGVNGVISAASKKETGSKGDSSANARSGFPGKDGVSSAVPNNQSGGAVNSSAKAVSCSPSMTKANGKAVLSSDVPTRRMGQSGVHSAKPAPVLSFADVKFGPQEAELKFRLIHLWEARNPHSKTLIGLEMLLIDEQGTVMKGFIAPGSI